MRTRLSHMSFARDFRRGISTFKTFGNISFLCEGKDSIHFWRGMLWPTIKCWLLEGSLGQVLARSWQGSVTSWSFHFSFDHALAYLKNEGEIHNCFRPGTLLGRKNQNLYRGEGEGVEKKLTVDYRSYHPFTRRKIAGKDRPLSPRAHYGILRK